MHKMELVEGRGNEFVDGRAREGDAINRVYVLDSDVLPFNQAEVRRAWLCTPAGSGPRVPGRRHAHLQPRASARCRRVVLVRTVGRHVTGRQVGRSAYPAGPDSRAAGACAGARGRHAVPAAAADSYVEGL